MRRNILANLLGNVWIAFLSLASIPVIVHFLGIASYGLVGFFSALTALLSLLDFGLGMALSREAAQASSDFEGGRSLRNLVRTLEVTYWVAGISIGLVIWAVSAPIVEQWLVLDQDAIADATRAVQMMALVIALRWPMPLYFSGLMGLQRQVRVNVLRSGFETVRIGGSILVIWLIEPSIHAFLAWQALAVLVFVIVSACMLWQALPRGVPAKFEFQQLRRIWKFAIGMAGVTMTGALLTQADKVVLSGFLSIEQFAFYMLASSAALGLFYLVSPISAAVFPPLARLAKRSDPDSILEVRTLYHKACQLVSFALLPAAALVAFFARDLLLLWTRDPVVVDGSSDLLAVIVIGNALNCLMLVPYALQLSSGWTSLALKINVIALIILPFLLWIGVSSAGAMGAAGVWVLLNMCYVFVGLPLMHRRILVGEYWVWLRRDVLPPLGISIAVGLFAIQFAPLVDGIRTPIIYLGTVYLTMVVGAGLILPHVRASLLGHVGWRTGL